MKNITKKIIVYSMVGMMQFGLGATLLEASPLHNDDSQRIVRLDNRHDNRQEQHDQRQRQEDKRHGQEMQRHHNENNQDWNNRQWRENQRHEQFRQDNDRQFHR